MTILAVLALTAAIVQLGRAVTSDWGADRGIRGEAWWFEAIALLARVGLGLLYGLIGVGLWRLRKWARGAFILWTLLGLVALCSLILISRFVADVPTPAPWFAVLLFFYGGLVIYYMMTADVKRAFGSQ